MVVIAPKRMHSFYDNFEITADIRLVPYSVLQTII